MNQQRNAIVIPPKPEPLSLYVLHTPEEVKRHKAQAQEYFEAVRATELEEERARQAEIAWKNRILTDSEYHLLKEQEWNEQRAKQVEREAAALAKKKEHEEYLASLPDVADVCSASFGTFLMEYGHWSQLGYALDPSGPLTALPALFHCTLKRPSTSKASTTH